MKFIEKLYKNFLGDGTPPKFRNFYKCPDDGREWNEVWTATCNDRCPRCNKEITPLRSEDL